MSIYYEVLGIIPADEKFEKYKKIWELCEEIGASIPNEVMEYFDNEDPEHQSRRRCDISCAVEKITYDTTVAHQVDLEKLPSNVQFIRFECQY